MWVWRRRRQARRRPSLFSGLDRRAKFIFSLVVLAVMGIAGLAAKSGWFSKPTPPASVAPAAGTCGAPLKSGAACRNHTADGGRCHLHK